MRLSKWQHNVPPDFGARVKRALKFWLPLWGFISLLPLVAGDYEDAVGKLLVGTPMVTVFVLIWAAARCGIDRLRQRTSLHDERLRDGEDSSPNHSTST